RALHLAPARRAPDLSAARANRVSSATASCASAGGTAGPPPTNTAAVDAAMSQSTNAGPAGSPRVVGSLTASTLPAYEQPQARRADRKSTRLNSSHVK